MKLKPAPVTLTCEIVKLAVPVFVKEMVCVLFDDTPTFPKLTLLALGVS